MMVNLATDEQFQCDLCWCKRWYTPDCVESAIERYYHVLYFMGTNTGRYWPMGFCFETTGLTMCIGCALDLGWIGQVQYCKMVL